jgi:hypothetical protein
MRHKTDDAVTGIEVFLNLTEVFLTLIETFLTLTEVFSCFFLSCKANSRVKLAKTGHGPHSSTLVCICVVRMLLFVLFGCYYLCCSVVICVVLCIVDIYMSKGYYIIV